MIEADPRLKVHGLAENLFLLSKSLHSSLLINHGHLSWYGDAKSGFTLQFEHVVNFENRFSASTACIWVP